VLSTNGQLETLRSGVTHCACELQLAKVPPLPPPLELRAASPQETESNKNAAAPRDVPKAAPKEAPTEVSRLATPKEIERASKEPAKPAAAAPATPKSTDKDGPVYQVYMPPLSYDAKAKVQPDNFDPQLIVLVRRARVRPALIFQGTVKDAPVIAKTPSPVAPAKPSEPPPQTQQAQQKNPQANGSIFSRIRAFFRSLFS
jgi:hypothetical protein